MKTITKILEEVAIKNGYKQWNRVLRDFEISTNYVNEMITEAAEIYANQSKQTFTEDQVKAAMSATMQGMINWIKSDSVFSRDITTKIPFENSEIEATNKESIADKFIAPELEKVGIIYKS